MARVVGVTSGDTSVAYAYERVAQDGPAGVIHDTMADREIVVLWRAGVASALEQPPIAEGRDVGSSGVFVPEAGGRTLSFEVRGGAFVDRETGSRWTLSGRAVEGPLTGERLEALPRLDTFWFAWWAYHPDTEVYGA